MNKTDNAAIFNPFGFGGEYIDLDSEKYYLQNRYYQPATGRFTQEDPIRNGLNWYAYCNNNPMMFIDSSGLAPYAAQSDYIRTIIST